MHVAVMTANVDGYCRIVPVLQLYNTCSYASVNSKFGKDRLNYLPARLV